MGCVTQYGNCSSVRVMLGPQSSMALTLMPAKGKNACPIRNNKSLCSSLCLSIQYVRRQAEQRGSWPISNRSYTTLIATRQYEIYLMFDITNFEL
jgi:hypothetical protein